MIKILKESEIEIPKPLFTTIVDGIITRMVSWVNAVWENRLKVLVKNKDISIKFGSEEYFEQIYLRKQKDIETLHKKYSKFIEEASWYSIKNFFELYNVSEFISSGYKYVLPLQYEGHLYIEVRFNETKGNFHAGYFPLPNGNGKIVIYGEFWKIFIVETMFSLEHSDFINRRAEEDSSFVISKLDEAILYVKRNLSHEMVHMVQLMFLPKGNWEMTGKINKEEDLNFGVYITTETEFYPHLKDAYYQYIYKYSKFSKLDFERFIYSNAFFIGLQQYDKQKYNKAIKQLYLALQKEDSND